MSRSSVALVNLRAVVILVVLAFHSVLPYLASLPPAAYPFDSAPYLWLAFPIVDSQRWFGFDLFCAWQDVGLMTLMFFLSGLFVPSSLARKGSWKFLSDRLLRIAMPFVLTVVLLSPIAYYAAYRTTAVDPGLDAFWQHWLALPFWPCGPQWFLGELLAFNILAAVAHRFIPGLERHLARPVAFAGGNPVRFFAVLAAISALAYVPLMLVYSPCMVEHRPHQLSVEPPAALSRLFPCRHCGRDPWPRPWPARLRRRSAAALEGMARRSLCRFSALGRADLGDGGGLGQRSPDREIRGRHGFCCRLCCGLPVRAFDLPALCTLAAVGVRQPVSQCLPNVSAPLCVCRLAAICAAGHRVVCYPQGRDRVRSHPCHELGDRCRHGRRAAAFPTECDHTRSARRVKIESTLDGRQLKSL